MQEEVLAICARQAAQPIHDLRAQTLLQSQHRVILGCIEAGLVEEGVHHIRTHARLTRDQVVAALSAGVGVRT
jgi:hypothetical protein